MGNSGNDPPAASYNKEYITVPTEQSRQLAHWSCGDRHYDSAKRRHNFNKIVGGVQKIRPGRYQCSVYIREHY